MSDFPRRTLRRRGGALAPRVLPLLAVPLLALPLVAALACAVNPATGNRQLSLVGEGAEIEMGREADPQILAAMGRYEEGELEAYVQGVGERLAAVSERPDLPWTFRVIDDPVVNAFAVPGGFIYVTRGILAHFQSEAELASVLGHEIGHVTARHSVNQMSKQQLFGLGLGIGMVLSPELASFGDLAQTGLGLLFLKYSRDDERQADDLGVRYMTRAGYDADEMPGVFEMLERVSSAQDAARIPGWLSTHPDPGSRAQRLSGRLAELDAGGRVNREEYLRRLDGVVFGEDPRAGFFQGRRFVHPELAFELRFPGGWDFSNQRQRVVALSSERDALIELTLAGADDAGRAAEAFLAQSGVSPARRWKRNVNGLTAVWATFEVPQARNPLDGSVVFIEHDARVYRLLGYGLSQVWLKHAGEVESTLGSFSRLTDRSLLSVEPARIDIVHLHETMALEELIERYPSNATKVEVALINRLEPGETAPTGALFKRVMGGMEK